MSGRSDSEAPTRVGPRPDASDETPAGAPDTADETAATTFSAEADAWSFQIPGYQILEEIHRGGQGVVYRAIQLGTKRPVALKVMLEGPLANEVARRRFEREVELAASLRHPNIVTILDSGVSQGRYYFAMEYIDGLRLDRYLAQVRPPLRETLRLFVRICDAVNFAHQRGVIHRDLKPPNILVDRTGEPHILDFGLAKPLPGADAQQSTIQMVSISGQLLGTVAYMSPEQTLGVQNVDVRSDVYSLGVIFYEALLGQLPYSVEGPLGEVLTRIAQAEPRPPRLAARRSPFGRLLDDELETILLKSLEKAPGRRYQTAGDLARDLRHLLAGEPIEAKRASGLYVLRKTLLRYRLQATAAAAVLLMLAGFLVFSLFMWTSEREARGRAAQQEQLAVNRAIELQRTLLALRRANLRQTIQRGELAQASGDLIAARGFFWDAYETAGGAAALLALRRYYLETGDHGSRVVCCKLRGPVALSPDGQLMAVCETPEAITVRCVADGENLAWYRAPGPVQVLSVGNDGSAFSADGTSAASVCAAGRGWARLWVGHELMPAVATALPRDFGVLNIHAAAGNDGLFIVGQGGVIFHRAGPSPDRHLSRTSTFTGETTESARPRAGALGEPARLLRLAGTPTGSSDYCPALGALAVVSTEGIELISSDEHGQFRVELIGPGALRPTFVQLTGDQVIAVDGQAVYLNALQGPQRGRWVQLAPAPMGWERADLSADMQTLAFSLADGHVRLYRGAQLERAWRVSSQGLLDLRLGADAQTVITVDRSASITRWMPPQQQLDVRQILPRGPTCWVVAEDASAVLLADAHGRAMVYAPERSERIESVSVRRPLRFQVSPADQTLLALSNDADRVVICSGSAIRLRDRASEALYAADWQQGEFAVLRHICLTGDGGLLACAAQTRTGERQQISFWRWSPQVRSRRSVELAALLPSAGPCVEFEGSAVREMRFIPGTNRLLVARSNGELVLLDAPASHAAPPTAVDAALLLPKAWTRVDSMPTRLALDRRGELLAVACEDGVIRVLTLPRGLARPTGPPAATIHIEAPVSALSFSSGADMLLVMTVDGRVSLFELETGERVGTWLLSAEDGATLATWLGATDLLLGDDGGLRVYSYTRLDRLILENRAYGRQRAAAQRLADGRFAAAWEAASRLRADDPRLAAAAQISVLENALRRVGADVAEDWITAATKDASGVTLVRLGHAAYEGERYALARAWLHAGAQRCGGQVDAYTTLCMAQCDYLLGDYPQAAQALAALLGRPDVASDLRVRHVDLDRGDRPTVQLLEVAALVLSGDLDQARVRTAEIAVTGDASTPAEVDAVTVARAIARKLTGLEEEASTSAVVREALKGLVGQPLEALVGQAVERLVGETVDKLFEERLRQFYLQFVDDTHFFEGELARSRGQIEEAAAQYQRCIDVAQDRWPANWARFRLRQLSGEAG